MRIKAIRSRSQYDLVLDPEVIWSCAQTAFGPGPGHDTGPDHEATQSGTQIDKFIYPGLPLMKPHFSLYYCLQDVSAQTNNFMQYRLQIGIYPVCHRSVSFVFPTIFFTKPPEAARTPATPQRSIFNKNFTNSTLNSIPNINLRRIWANFNTASPAGQSHNPISAGRAHSTIFQVTETHKHNVTSGAFAAPAGQNTKAGLPPCSATRLGDGKEQQTNIS